MFVVSCSQLIAYCLRLTAHRSFVAETSLKQRTFCVNSTYDDPDPAKNCVDNTSKVLQKLKCFKSSETRSNMPITRLEMVGFTFRFKVKRHRNAAERNGMLRTPAILRKRTDTAKKREGSRVAPYSLYWRYSRAIIFQFFAGKILLAIFLATAFSGEIILSTASIKREMMKQFVWTTKLRPYCPPRGRSSFFTSIFLGP